MAKHKDPPISTWNEDLLDGKCWMAPAPASAKKGWKFNKILEASNEKACCPVDYEKLFDLAHLEAPFVRPPTEAEEKRMEDVTFCTKLATNTDESAANECAETKTVRVNERCVKMMERINHYGLETGYPFLGSDFGLEFLKTILQNDRGCYKAEMFYTGNGVNGIGFGEFNCLLRNLYSLGVQDDSLGPEKRLEKGVIPQAIMRVAATLKAELEGHQTTTSDVLGRDDNGAPLIRESRAAPWNLSEKNLVYRGSFCHPWKVGDKIFASSFLSFAMEPQSNYIGKTSCVYGAKNVNGAVPHTPYEQEAEVLVPFGGCMVVEKGDGTTKNLFDGASKNQKRATKVLSEIQYGGEFLLKGISCEGEDLTTFKLM